VSSYLILKKITQFVYAIAINVLKNVFVEIMFLMQFYNLYFQDRR